MSLGTFFADYEKSGMVRREVRVPPLGESYLETHDAVEGTSLTLLSSWDYNDWDLQYYCAVNVRICQLGYHAWLITRHLINLNCYNLPTGIVKSAAALFLCKGTHWQDVGKADVCVVEGMFGDTLTLADYSVVNPKRLGSVIGGIVYYPWERTNFHIWDEPIPLNEAGLGWITSGTTKLGVRLSGDIEAWEPVDGDPPGSGCGSNALGVYNSEIETWTAEQVNRHVRWTLSAVCSSGKSALLGATLWGYNCPYLEVSYTGASSPTYPRHRFMYYRSDESMWAHQTEWRSGIATFGGMSASISIEYGKKYYFRVQTQKVEGGTFWYSYTGNFTCYFSSFVSSLTHRCSPGHYSCEIGLGEIEVKTPSYDIEPQPTLGGG